MLNVENWIKFKIKDLFVCSTTSPVIETDIGSIPYVTRTAMHNGVDSFIMEIDGKLNQGNCITIGAEGRCAFYQPTPFISGVKIYTLRNQNLNMYNALFISTILNKELYRYCYGRARILDKIKEEDIFLPATKEGTPDWKEMEKYIRSLPIKQPYTKNNFLKKLPNNKIRYFFKIKDIFDNIIPTKGTTTDSLIPGNEIPYIGATKVMNGLMDKVARRGNEDFISDGNCLVFVQLGAGGSGYVTYQEKEFIGMSGKTCCGYSKHLNKYNGLYLATMLCQERFRYSFGRSWTGERLLNTQVELPSMVNNKGKYEPDWLYMENYIKSLPYGDII